MEWAPTRELPYGLGLGQAHFFAKTTLLRQKSEPDFKAYATHPQKLNYLKPELICFWQKSCAYPIAQPHLRPCQPNLEKISDTPISIYPHFLMPYMNVIYGDIRMRLNTFKGTYVIGYSSHKNILHDIDYTNRSTLKKAHKTKSRTI